MFSDAGGGMMRHYNKTDKHITNRTESFSE